MLFLAAAQKRVSQACTSARRGRSCAGVPAVVREHAGKQVCMFMSDTITWKRDSSLRQGEKYCSDPGAD